MAKKCEFKKKNGERCGADAQTGKISAFFTIQAGQLRVAEPDAQEASLVVERRRCFHPTRRIIR